MGDGMREVSEGEAVRRRAQVLFNAFLRGNQAGDHPPLDLDELGDLWRAAVRAAEGERDGE